MADNENSDGGEPKPRNKGQWQKGGPTPNPHGRKGKPRDPGNVFAKALDEPVTLPSGGRKKKYTKLQLGAIQLANKVAKGDTPSTKMVMNWMRQEEDRKAQTAAAANYVFGEDDLKTIANVVARIRALTPDDDAWLN